MWQLLINLLSTFDPPSTSPANKPPRLFVCPTRLVYPRTFFPPTPSHDPFHNFLTEQTLTNKSTYFPARLRAASPPAIHDGQSGTGLDQIPLQQDEAKGPDAAALVLPDLREG